MAYALLIILSFLLAGNLAELCLSKFNFPLLQQHLKAEGWKPAIQLAHFFHYHELHHLTVAVAKAVSNLHIPNQFLYIYD